MKEESLRNSRGNVRGKKSFLQKLIRYRTLLLMI